jgi:hypothetical protein
MVNSATTDFFTGGASSSTPNDWSDTSDWTTYNDGVAGATGVLPGADSVVEQSGAATIDDAPYTIEGLILDSGADLAIGSSEQLDVTGPTGGVTFAAFGGLGSTIDVAGQLVVGSGVTSAQGSVTVDSEGRFEFDGSGSTQLVTVDTLGVFDLAGSNNDTAIVTSPASTLQISGSHDGGTLNLLSGGTVFMGSQFNGTIENLSSSGGIALYYGQALAGTPTGYSIDSSNNTVTFDFSTSSGTVTETLNFSSVAGLHIGEDVAGGGFGISTTAPTDTFTATTANPTFSTTTGWSTDQQPTPGTAITVNGAAVLNETNTSPASGSTVEDVAGLAFGSNASLDIPTGDGLYVSGFSETAFGGATSTIDVHGDLVVGVFATSASGAVNVHPGGYYVYDGSGSTQAVSVQTGGLFVMAGWSNAGTVSLTGGEFEFDGGLGGANDTTAVNMSGGGTFLDSGGHFGGVISNLGMNGSVLVSDGKTAGNPTTYSVDASNNTITFNFSSTDSYTLAFSSVSNLSVTSGSTDFTVKLVCFASGGRIRTTRGEVAVEDLQAGDLAVTASGAARSIVWIGSKRIERPLLEQQPIRVMAGAFGEGLPARDLRLSHGHAVCVDALGEVLVPVGELVNGVTIVREEVAEVTYWHVELESHDVLLAEGLPAESYLDTGNRAFFGRGYGRLPHIDPDRTLADSCRPFVAEGPLLEAIRERLAARALSLAAPDARRAA